LDEHEALDLLFRGRLGFPGTMTLIKPINIKEAGGRPVAEVRKG
jgi:hypothetical protein